MFNRSIIIITSFRSIATQFVFLKPIMSGVPNDSFLSNPLKRNFRLSGVLLKLCSFISGRAIIFLSVLSF